MANKTKIDTGRNFALAEAMIGKRTSSAAGKHADKRAKRARTRAAAKNRAMGDWA